MSGITASTIADYIILARRAKGDKITQLKIQKLVYYVQAWHLGLYGSVIFSEEIEAWVHGPVIPSVRSRYRDLRWSPLPVPATSPDLPSRIQVHIDKVLSVYGDLSASDLEEISHVEDPWVKARANMQPSERSNCIIAKSAMKEYFSALGSERA